LLILFTLYEVTTAAEQLVALGHHVAAQRHQGRQQVTLLCGYLCSARAQSHGLSSLDDFINGSSVHG
jgi:hypothetical protein